MKSAHKQNLIAAALVCGVALTTTVAQAADEARSVEYEMKVERAVQRCLWRLPLSALDVLEQNFQQGIGVKSDDLGIYEGCRNREPVGATYDTGEKSQ